MSAKDYPITLSFGATTAPYSVSARHEGTDRGCPTGTDVIVSGKTIAKSGSTGYTFGPHTHYAKFVKGYRSGGIYNQSFNRTYFTPNDAFDITGTVSFAQMNGTAGNEVIIDADNGYSYRFLHNSQILVKVGDKIAQGGDMSTIGEVEFNYLFFSMFGNKNQPTGFDRQRWIGAETNTVIRAMQSDPRREAWVQYVKDLENAGGGSGTTKESALAYIQSNLK